MTVFEGQKKCREFFNITKINPWEYKDEVMMLASNSFQLDVIKMDEMFRERFKEEYSEDMSMSDFLIKRWGDRANAIINEMIQ